MINHLDVIVIDKKFLEFIVPFGKAPALPGGLKKFDLYGIGFGPDARIGRAKTMLLPPMLFAPQALQAWFALPFWAHSRPWKIYDFVLLYKKCEKPDEGGQIISN